MAAYFTFAQKGPDEIIRLFFFKLLNDDQIVDARSILADSANPRRSVQGTIIQSPAPYNPYWTFHLKPDSIGFFELQIEVCDANAVYVQEHLDEVGGSFLPRSFWCPWSSHLLAEVTHMVDPGSETLRF